MKKITINPKDLVFRENMQNRLDNIRSRFSDIYNTITVVDDGTELIIIDGHNRASVAEERGHMIDAAIISKKQYNMLQAKGYDDMEISYAILTAVDDIDSAMTYVDQFAGSNIFVRGEAAYQILEETNND